MTGNHSTDDGFEPDPDDALRSGLRACADLVTITPPPIAAVRRRAQRRLRRRRGMIHGVMGLAATCAVVAGIVAWSPGRAGNGPVVSSGTVPAPAVPVTPITPTSVATEPTTAGPVPSGTALSAPLPLVSVFLKASDLGPGWKGPIGKQNYRPELMLDGSQCESAGVYQAQVPLMPAMNLYFEEYSSSGARTNEAWEAVYTFAPGTGPAVMGKVRLALATGCGQPQTLKVLAYPSTAADEAIVFTAGGDSRNLLVRSGDRVASALVSTVSSGQDGATSMDELAQQMATRLTTG